MDNLARLLLRFLLVPFGYLAAVFAGAVVTLFGAWRLGTLFAPAAPDEAPIAFILGIVTAVAVLILLLSMMWLVAAVGILFSEAFAIRSWMFHVGNGVISAWIGARILSPAGSLPDGADDTFYVVAAGLAGGLAYWLVAGSTAGFFKPILRSPAERAALPPAEAAPSLPARDAAPPPAAPGGPQNGTSANGP